MKEKEIDKPTKRVYQSSLDFRSAIQEKFKRLAIDQNLDPQTLNRMLAYERFLARLFNDHEMQWALKGGHALELRLQRFRGTKDIDLVIKEMKLFSPDREQQKNTIIKKLREKCAINLEDYFTFTIIDGEQDISNLPYGGYKFTVKSFIGGKLFHAFSLDVGVGDVWIDPQDMLPGKGLLEFMGIEAPSIRVIKVEQHFAEKIHSYSMPRGERINTRVKDFYDLVLLIREFESKKNFDPKVMVSCLDKTYKRRKTHDFLLPLPLPPSQWSIPFEALMKNGELVMEGTLDSCYQEINDFMSDLMIVKRKA